MHDSSSTSIHSKLAFFDVTRNKRHAPHVPSDIRNKQFKFSGNPMCCSRDIRMSTKASLIGRKLRRRGRSPKDDGNLSCAVAFNCEELS